MEKFDGVIGKTYEDSTPGGLKLNNRHREVRILFSFFLMTRALLILAVTALLSTRQTWIDWLKKAYSLRIFIQQLFALQLVHAF